jgi:hypothetical protein
MARGWESKSVEAQIESSESGNRNAGKEHPSPQEAELLRKREGLLLSRTRVLRDLGSARNPRYKKILQEALDYLDRELARIAAGRISS